MLTQTGIPAYILGTSYGFRALGGVNMDAVLMPSGTGGVIAGFPDGTATGGNARGASAVDLQTQRNSATQVASGAYSGVLSGDRNTSTATASVVSGGRVNTINANFAWCPGGVNYNGRQNYGKGGWAVTAATPSEAGEALLQGQTTDATLTRLTADGGAPGAANTFNLGNFTVEGGRLIVIARQQGGTAAAQWALDIALLTASGAGSAVLFSGAVASIAPTFSNGTGSAWRLTVAADTTNGGVAVSVAGAAATTINWAARFMSVTTRTTS